MQKDTRKTLLGKVGSSLVAYVLLPFLLLLALEGGARLFAPDDLALRRAQEELIDDRNGEYPYLNRAGFQGDIWQREVNINQQHLRSPEFDADTDTTARILLIGDSVIFGLGLADEEAPTMRLEAHLNNEYRVLNGGVPGYTISHTLAYLKQFGDRFRPDAVVLGYCLNDPVPGDQQTVMRVQEADNKLDFLTEANLWLRSHSILYLQLKSWFNVYRVRHDYKNAYLPLYNESSWERSSADLLEISQWSQERGIPFLIAIFPHRDQLIDEVPTDDYPQRLLAEFQEKVGYGGLLDLRSVLNADDFIPNDALHLDKRGMDKSMQAIAHFLQTDPQALSMSRVKYQP